MEQCKEQLATLQFPEGKFSENKIGLIFAQEDGFKEGWKAALEWIKKEIEMIDDEVGLGLIILEEIINKELKGG